MGQLRQHAPRTHANPIHFAADYPNQHRLQDSVFFRQALGNCGLSTFEQYVANGRVPPADIRHGKRRMWRETAIAQTVEAFAVLSRGEAA